MSWYAASAIFVFRVRSGKQRRFPVWENVYLIEATSDVDALRKAEQLAKDQQVTDATLTLDGKPAELSYAGIRKVLTIENPFPADPNADRPRDGTEVTYSEFTVSSEKEIKKLLRGERLSVVYEA